ncbi:glycosyltransferase [Butyrivibrio sp. VCD2006]|uniref:glycosyltransferase n=1 Tax=Butyrivibrio sp. VCD2006 TaxID=1280664 RepID=UPI00040B8F44|nr:glycosyltransferase [Butyrivibrio sp. VCD2006]
MKRPLFSIVIPVYNREQYIDRAVESVICQTYDDWELILVDDGSTDSSAELCDIYSKRDNRIRVLHEDNRGPGAARNCGLNVASGEYVLFLDSDDWYELNCLKECADVIRDSNPDLITFFMREHTEREVRINKRALMPWSFSDIDRQAYLMSRDISVGTRACKRSIIEENRVRFPEWTTAEDVCFMLLCYAVCSSVIQIKKAFYNYDKKTPLSATKQGLNGIENLFSIPVTIYSKFEEMNCIGRFRNGLAKYFMTEVKHGLMMAQNDEIITDKLNMLFKGETQRLFPGIYEKVVRRYLVFGSYTLRSAVQSIVIDNRSVSHYQFQSVISAMQDGKREIPFWSDNNYRNEMIKRELSGCFREELARCNYDYLVIDFLEERYGMIRIGNYWLTNSDAWNEGNSSLDSEIIELSTFDKNVFVQFLDSCNLLIDFINKTQTIDRVILVENYLMEYKGEWGQEECFDNQREIRQINKKLKRCYEHFENKLPNIKVIRPHEMGDCFSDIGYKHGCVPAHSCESWESYMGYLIFENV